MKFDELWSYRELLYFLVWRNVKVRYKQAELGVAWTLLKPLLLMIVFTLFFGKMAEVPSNDIPYPLFSYAALLPWMVISQGITGASESLVSHQPVITRVYFPRIAIPLAVVLSATLDFAIASVLLVGLMFFYGMVPGISLVWLPAFVLLMAVTASGFGFWLSAMNLEFRDIRQIMPFLNRLLMFLSPLVYPTSMVPDRWRYVYALNPIVGVIEGFRWSLFGQPEGSVPLLVISGAVGLLIFLLGILFFHWRERTFIDVAG